MGSLKLTGSGTFDRSLPMKFLMMPHTFRRIDGLFAIVTRRGPLRRGPLSGFARSSMKNGNRTNALPVPVAEAEAEEEEEEEEPAELPEGWAESFAVVQP